MISSELKNKWVAALRSGKYHQGIHHLCQLDMDEGVERHCCLGVLADILDHDGWSEPVIVETGGGNLAIREFGLFELDGEHSPFNDDFLPVGVQESLTFMNDGGATFAEIATFIEESAAFLP